MKGGKTALVDMGKRRRRRIFGKGLVEMIHKKINGDKGDAKTGTAVDDLTTKRVAERHLGIGLFIDNVENDGVGDGVASTTNDANILFRNGSSGFINLRNRRSSGLV